MASILDLNPEMRGQIAKATASGGPKKRAKVFFTKETEFEKEAKRMLPLLEKKYGKGMVDLIPVEYGDAKGISKAIAEEPAGDTFIFDHAGDKMLGIPMSKEDAMREAKNHETQASQIASYYHGYVPQSPEEKKWIEQEVQPWSKHDLFIKYLSSKYPEDKIYKLNNNELENEWVEMNQTKNYPKQYGPFIPEEEYDKILQESESKDVPIPDFENISKEGTQIPIYSTDSESGLQKEFQIYLRHLQEAKNARAANDNVSTWANRFPKDYKGDCYWGACHFADKANQFAKNTGIPTYATMNELWRGGNPKGEASTQEEFLKNLYYNTDLAKYGKENINVLQDENRNPKMESTMQVTPTYQTEIVGQMGSEQERPQQTTTVFGPQATPEETQEINRLMQLHANDRAAQRAALQPIYDRINARRTQR